MKWLKYKHKWAYKIDDPEYIEIPDDYFNAEGSFDAEEFIEDYGLCKEWNYSDKYRGIDYEIVDNPPREIVIGLIGKARARIEGAKRSLERYSALLESIDTKATR